MCVWDTPYAFSQLKKSCDDRRCSKQQLCVSQDSHLSFSRDQQETPTISLWNCISGGNYIQKTKARTALYVCMTRPCVNSAIV